MVLPRSALLKLLPCALLLAGCSAGSAPEDAAKAASRDLRWVVVEPVPPWHLSGLFFLDEHNGWLLGGQGEIGRTSDGGRTWVVVKGAGRLEYWRGVWFLDARRGFIVGGLASPHEDFIPPKIIVTEDGGRTWSDITPEQYRGKPHAAFEGIQFVSPTEGFIFGQQLLATKDAGKTWVAVGEDKRVSGYRTRFTSATVGWSLRDSDLWKTTDGGETWQRTPAQSVLEEEERRHNELDRLSFSNDRVGCAVTGWGTLVRTEDGGQTWTVQGKIPHFRDSLVFTDPLHGWAVAAPTASSGSSCIMRTTDGGRTWQESTESAPQLRDLIFLGKSAGWAMGDGTLLRYTADP